MSNLSLTAPLAESTHARLLAAIAHATGHTPGSDVSSQLSAAQATDPSQVRAALAGHLGDTYTVVVTGALDRRLLLIRNIEQLWTAADLSGQPHRSRTWPAWTEDHLTITDPSTWLSAAELTEEALHRLLRPRLLLASLYHPENFPLPRFPLAISDLARAARSTLLGNVELMDMQLDVTLDDIIERATSSAVDILGVSATFGQHDLMTQLLDAVTDADNPPMLLAGGSLTARNEHILLERYPNLIIGRGAGEPVIADILGHWHGDLPLDQVRGVGYRGAARGEGTLTIGRARRTATVANRQRTDIWPELDLLDRTLDHHGVAQLEFSRGCTNFCSFCPRGHKGQWAGALPTDSTWMLHAIGEVFDRHPETSRTLYLVDEEFIGRAEDAVGRALAAADTLAAAGFAWETSCRVDQAARLDRDRDWHIERAHMWRGLLDRRLRRCLFGVESGVTSILERFNKETTSAQNTLAIRTLSALGVPTRFTYITFDHLMSEAELRGTFRFQGRTDLLLRPAPECSAEEIVDGVRDEQWVAAHSSGRPFYTGITYMLVGMECLIGAAYTRKADAAGLTGPADPSMGRVEARYADWRIGVLAKWGQLWIDRNFALDYTLKSLEKIVDGRPHRAVRSLRRVLKDAAYRFLGGLIGLLDTTAPDDDPDTLDARSRELGDALITELRSTFNAAVASVHRALSKDNRELLRGVHRTWAAATTWQLINAADPCGT
jgi:hypothetical protein